MALERFLVRQAAEAEEGFLILEEYAQSPSPSAVVRAGELSRRAEATARSFLRELEAAPVGVGRGLSRSEAFLVSRALEEMMERAKAAVTEMIRFDIPSDSLTRELALAGAGLCRGLSAALKTAPAQPRASSSRLVAAKRDAKRMADLCREASGHALRGPDVVAAMKVRALYQHFAEAARRADEAADRIGDAAARAA